MNVIPRLSRRVALKWGIASISSLLLPPVALAETLFTFFVIGDWGDPEKHQKEVAQAMVIEATATPPNMIVSVGDNFYPSGVASVTDSQWKTTFEDVYSAPQLSKPWYVVLGNHDRQGNAEAQFEYQRVNPRWHMPSRYFTHVEQLGVGVTAKFFFIDTNGHGSGEDDSKASELDRAQFDWLERELADSKAPWKFVVGHHPVFSGGYHGSSPALIQMLKPLLDKYNVQAYFCGHDHDMQHLKVDNVHYIITGSGSKARPTSMIQGSLFAAAEVGFLKASLSANVLEASWIGSDQRVLHSAVIPVG